MDTRHYNLQLRHFDTYRGEYKRMTEKELYQEAYQSYLDAFYDEDNECSDCQRVG